jgi:hypothetical protein
MPNILIIHDPAGVGRKEKRYLPEGNNLLEFLIKTYGRFHVPTKIYKKKWHEDNEIEQSYENLNVKLSENDFYIIVHRPQGGGGGIFGGAVSSLWSGITFAHEWPVMPFGLSGDAQLLFSPLSALNNLIPTPDSPEAQRQQDTDNNAVSGQTNKIRLLQRIPDNYGRMRIYPDLIAQPYFYFENNNRFLVEYFGVGRGSYAISELKDSETLISDIIGSSATVYEPETRPSTVLNVRESNAVDGQELYGTNNKFVDITSVTVDFNAADSFQSTDDSFESFFDLIDGDSITLTNASNGDDIENNGTYTFSNVTRSSQGGDPEVFLYTVYVDETLDYDVSTGELGGVGISSTEGASSEIGYFNVPLEPDEVWVDIQFLRGLMKADGNPLRIDFDITLQRVSDDSTEVTRVSVTSQTRSAYSETFVVVPDHPGEEYRCKVARVSDHEDDDLDVSQWTRLAGVEYVTVDDFGDITTILVETRQTAQAVRAKQRKFNCIAERKLGTWTGTGTTFTSAAATSRMADALVNILTDPSCGNKSISEIDLTSLYEIQDRLDDDDIYDDKLGRFCYSFGDASVSVYSEAVTCANACRVVMYREGSMIKFKRDEAKPIRTTLFNVRNKAPDSETKSINLFTPTDNDGIELDYITEEGESGIIYFPEDQSASNPHKITGAGIRNYEQAWNRAYYEYQRLIYKRISVSTTVTSEGLLCELTDRVANVDGTNIASQSGEIKDYDGLTIYTHDKITFDSENTNLVILRNTNGAVNDAIEITAIEGNEYGFVLSESPSITLAKRGANGIQVGTLYIVVTDNNSGAVDYMVEKIIPKNDGYVDLELSNYSPEIYTPDTTEPT